VSGEVLLLYSIRRTSPDPIDIENKYHPQCALALQVHAMEGMLFKESIVSGEVLLYIRLGGPHQTPLMVQINTIRSVHMHDRFLLKKICLHYRTLKMHSMTFKKTKT
jgi:hypothetical protein